MTVRAGYLGAGKTTLLNRSLSENHGKKYTVVINGLGELGVDNDLVVDADQELFEMNNGCICCNVRENQIRTVGQLVRRRGQLDGIIIETAGLADPSPVAQTVSLDEQVKTSSRLDAMVTVVAAKHLPARLDDGHEAEALVAFADVIVLNKTDLVTPNEPEAAEARIRTIDRSAQILRAEKAAVPLTELLGRGDFDLARILEMEPNFLSGEDNHEHDDAVTSVSLTSDTPIDMKPFNAWIGAVLAEHSQDLLCTRGICISPGMMSGLRSRRFTCPRMASSSTAARTVIQGRFGSCSTTQHQPSHATARLRGLCHLLTIITHPGQYSARLGLGFVRASRPNIANRAATDG